MLKLIIEDDEGRKTVVPFVREEITIGRQEGNTIRLTERNVSRRHARLMRQNGHILIEDLGSYNGIKVNGDRITGQVTINDGDLIQIGDYDLAVEAEDELRPAPPAAPTIPLPPPSQDFEELQERATTSPTLQALDPPQAADEDVHDVEDRPTTVPNLSRQATAIIRGSDSTAAEPRTVEDLDVSEAPRLVVLNTDQAGREFVCARTEIRIGRTEENDIAIDHRSLSRTHCKLLREDDGDWRIVDLESANGVLVNGEPYAQVSLRNGDQLELGHVKLKFVATAEPYIAPTTGQVTLEARPTSLAKSVLAVASALVVLIIGIAGYALWDSGTGPGAEGKSSDPTRKADLASQRQAVERTLASARVAIEALEFPKAEALLRECTVGGAQVPEATALLAAVETERPHLQSLEAAQSALAVGDLDKAGSHLSAAATTTLLRSRLEQLRHEHAAKLAEKMGRADVAHRETAPRPGRSPSTTAVAESAPTPEATETPAQLARNKAKALFETALKDFEGFRTSRARNEDEAVRRKWLTSSRGRLEQCIRVDRTYASCYRQLGTVLGHLGDPGDLVQKNYRLYLKFAEPGDEYIPRVQKWFQDSQDPQYLENRK